MSISEEENDVMQGKRDQLRKEINKNHNTSVVTQASELIVADKKVVSVSPMADYNLGGGIPEGTWLILSGLPKAGKTVTALQIAANAQKQYGKPVYIGSVEHRINKKELEGIHGLDVSEVEMIQSTAGKILTAQDFLQEFTTVIKSIPGCVLIIDSTSALCAEGEFANVMNDKSLGRNEGPRLLAQFCRKMTGVVPVQNTIVIVIQHLIANTSGYGEPYYEDGGRKMQHQADTKLRCTTFQKWENTKKDDQIGQVINWQIKTAALTKPGGKFQSYLRYGYGLDDIKEYMSLGLDMGVIEKGGAWYTFGNLKAQGEDKLRAALADSPDTLEQLKQQVQQML